MASAYVTKIANSGGMQNSPSHHMSFNKARVLTDHLCENMAILHMRNEKMTCNVTIIYHWVLHSYSLLSATIVGFWGDHQILPVSDRLARFDLDV